MKYYFPGLFSDTVFSEIEKKTVQFPFEYHLNSGENALRLLLRSFQLKPKAKVAIPAFVCSSVKNAVIREGLTPVLFDLKNDDTFWTAYDLDKIKSTQIKVVLLVHLYGFIHPDTATVVEFCRKNDIKLIQDAAQSYGIDKHKISGAPVVYSFGPGKSTTAGGGAIVVGFEDAKRYRDAIKQYSVFQERIVKIASKFFLRSRIYGHSIGFMDSLLKRMIEKIYTKVISPNSLYPMVPLQQVLAVEAMNLIVQKKVDRGLRHQLLKDSLKNSSHLLLAYDDMEGMYFKFVLFVKGDVDAFQNYLSKKEVPFFRLFENTWTAEEGNPFFKTTANRFFEISCEASIPLEEMNRVANVLRSYS